jgi:hypothetical protein
VDDLLAVMLEARRLIALPENDFSWSSFIDQKSALEEIDEIISDLEEGTAHARGVAVLFLPTGPMQEVALSSGWGDEFVALADRFDLTAAAHVGSATHFCGRCGNEAGKLTCADGELRRVSFTSVLTQRETPAVRAVIGSARALYELDFELAPFFCPECDRSYCGEHWNATDIFEDGVHDSIRGTCPEGHERLLED